MRNVLNAVNDNKIYSLPRYVCLMGIGLLKSPSALGEKNYIDLFLAGDCYE